MPEDLPELFRKRADDCVRLARECRSDKDRAAFLEMAQSWLEAAIKIERALTDIDPMRQKRSVN